LVKEDAAYPEFADLSGFCAFAFAGAGSAAPLEEAGFEAAALLTGSFAGAEGAGRIGGGTDEDGEDTEAEDGAEGREGGGSGGAGGFGGRTQTALFCSAFLKGAKKKKKFVQLYIYTHIHANILPDERKQTFAAGLVFPSSDCEADSFSGEGASPEEGWR
jgi:hypothetical protein